MDLDETLVHSSFKHTSEANIVVSLEIDGRRGEVFVKVRPGVEQFLELMNQYYEIIIFTASREKYAGPLMDILDDRNLCSGRLFRDSCTDYQGMYVKDLSKLGLDLKDIVIIDNSPTAYTF